MSEPRLVKPSKKFKQSFIQAVKEFQEENYGPYLNLDIQSLQQNFDQYLEKLQLKKEGKHLKSHQVPFVVYWLVKDSQFLGKTRIRPELNDFYRQKYGNIGYSIRPTARGKGYGSIILKKALKKAQELGLNQVLLTCKSSNAASQKVIQKNGGKLIEKKLIKKPDLYRLYFKIEL